MARTLLKEKKKKALAARARMAKRAKRARFIKENKKRITMCVVAFFALMGLAFFTPFGPDYYYGEIDMRRFSSPGVVTPGVLRDLYKLGSFYSMTLREKQAQEMFDEIGTMYFGFKITEYAARPQEAEERRFEAERRISRGDSLGPPYKIADADLPYVGLAIRKVADSMMTSGPRDFPRRLYNDLYMGQFYQDHPSACDPKVTTHMKNTGDRLAGRR